MMANKYVYVGMVGDMLHAGHINVLNKAKTLGKVIVGVLTDEAVADYKRIPFMRFDDRVKVVESLAGIYKVVPQNTLSYKDNLISLRPKYVVHGDDWQFGDKVSAARHEVIHVLNEWGGELIEIPYTVGVSSTLINQALEEDGIVARARQGRLRRLLEVKDCIRIIEAHSALSAIVAYKAKSEDRVFHGLWQSSFTDSTQRGKADVEIVDHSDRLTTINEIFDATPLPLIYDGDTGGQPERVYHLTKSLDRAGVSALCLEDKTGAKRNSLYGDDIAHEQASIELFCDRIRAAKRAITSGQMMFIARIESLVVGAGHNDALRRADAYIGAGADALLIHSVSKAAGEVVLFCAELRKVGIYIPIFVVPTTYGHTHEDILADAGVNAIIYANHLLRSAYPAMVATAQHILRAGRSDDDELRGRLATTKQFLDLFPPEV